VITLDRRPLVAGNWKLHTTLAEARTLAAGVVAGVAADAKAEVCVAPPFVALTAVRDVLRGSPVALGAQDVYWEDRGAFTGEVSAPQLADAGCAYVIVGHSERRQLFGERDEDVRRKLGAVFAHGMTPIVCVGESLAQRERGETLAHVLGQVDAAVEGLDDEALARLVVAYEPIWAIGTGRNARPEDAQEVHAAIRKRVAERANHTLADGMRVLYGGSVKPENARELLAQRDVDGALVGGASLDAAAFCAIVRAS
jgi:triosephosphate isomerase